MQRIYLAFAFPTILFLTCLASQYRSSGFQSLDTADFVRASGTTSLKPDHEEILVTPIIAKDYHINANPATYDYLIPTSVSFQEIVPQHTSYPQATLFNPAPIRSGLIIAETAALVIIAKLALLVFKRLDSVVNYGFKVWLIISLMGKDRRPP